jgi:hypothetical protein
MRATSRNLVWHYQAGGDYAENGIAAGRVSEIDTRYAEDMLARLCELADVPLAQPRQPRERLVGCCRDYTVLFLAIARQHGVPARARVGFASYFRPGWFFDHVIAEVWDAGQQRWRLVEPELADGYADPADGTVIDPEDVPSARFLTGARAWLACRSGSADASRFLVDPDLSEPATRGWPYVRHNLIHDLAALAGHEMLLWDGWGLTELEGEPTPAQLALLDELASAISRADVPVDQIQAFSAHPDLCVPPVVTSHSPAREAPLHVALRGLPPTS